MRLPGAWTVIAGIVVLTFAVSLAAYPYLPGMLATHWGLSGQVNGYLPKAWGLLVVPVISAALALLFRIIPRIDPLKANIAKFRPTYDRFVMVILLFLLYVSLLTIAWNAGVRFNLAQLLSPAFGVLYYACGVLIGRARRNWFVGIRTPWTLSSDRVWDRTHAVGGRLFRAAGVLAFLGAAFPGTVWIFLLGPVIVISVYLVVYSYREYQREAKEAAGGPGAA
ncbi:MAG TPA: SdpI family protein [Methanomicrobiales archaeon]|nr:SdpI family protein [Methanomicrobiales archaeon]